MEQLQLVRFEIDDARLAVRLAGDPKKPAVVLIHGLPNSSNYFRNVMAPLARDCFVIAAGAASRRVIA